MKTDNYSVLLLSFILLSGTASAAPQRIQGVDDTVTTDANLETIVRVLDNDIGKNLKLTTVNSSSVNEGSVRISADSTYLIYTPKTDYIGSDQFAYNFEDSRGRSDSAEVFVTISAVEDVYTGWPVAITDTASTVINTPVDIPVLANDLGQSLTIIESNTYTDVGGMTSIAGSEIKYIPLTNFTGEDSFWYSISDLEGRTNSINVTVTIADNGGGGDTGVGLTNFDLVPIQNNVMYGVNYQYPETGGFVNFKIDAAPAGATVLRFRQGSSPSVLIPNQLVTYIGVDGEYYTSSVAQVKSKSITLNQPLKVGVARSSNLQNFYADPNHPHVGGFNAVVDFALRELNDPSLDAGKHVLLGDSWFTQDFVKNRLQVRLPNSTVVSKGWGGNKASDLLLRFDQDVASQDPRPKVVWVMAGTNDAYAGVSKEDFVENMRQIIEKIIAIDARPILFDTPLPPRADLMELSKSYTLGLAEMQSE